MSVGIYSGARIAFTDTMDNTPSTILYLQLQGALQDGQVFDSSRKEGREPFSIKLGAGQVIPGLPAAVDITV